MEIRIFATFNLAQFALNLGTMILSTFTERHTTAQLVVLLQITSPTTMQIIVFRDTHPSVRSVLKLD